MSAFIKTIQDFGVRVCTVLIKTIQIFSTEP